MSIFKKFQSPAQRSSTGSPITATTTSQRREDRSAKEDRSATGRPVTARLTGQLTSEFARFRSPARGRPGLLRHWPTGPSRPVLCLPTEKKQTMMTSFPVERLKVPRICEIAIKLMAPNLRILGILDSLPTVVFTPCVF